MDPYLESPDVFPSLHDALIVGLMETLQPRLPEPYFAQTREHVWLEVTDRYIEPDVTVSRSEGRDPQAASKPSGVAVAPHPRIRPVTVTLPTLEHRELSLEIHTRQDPGFRLVTAIEILSPSNKTQGNQRHQEYVQKQRELLQGSVNLVEIDLLRGGTHTTAVPRTHALRAAGPFDYHVCVHRFHRPGELQVYPIRLEDVLPEVDVPLLPADGTVRVDLQAVFTRACDGGPFRRRVRYGVDEIAPPLGAREREWAEKVLAGGAG
jgi:hypothetical protein